MKQALPAPAKRPWQPDVFPPVAVRSTVPVAVPSVAACALAVVPATLRRPVLACRIAALVIPGAVWHVGWAAAVLAVW